MLVAFFGSRFVRALLLSALLLGPAAMAWAGCTDAAAPQVNWRRCLQDGRILSRVDLTGAQLRDVSLTRATMDGAILTGAEAYGAKFNRATLPGAKLDSARLANTDFTDADLTGADLSKSDLRNARFVGAKLRGATLTGAELRGTVFRDADLSGATWTDGAKICAEGSIGLCE
ncbi:pentapeptide repeat-containing protein [Inquilinus sp. OTU3971]|uniref:pentapeptide repeat-containing protein n=1 Tax=Inquilinus sp. OTU3971 TaxID=3043855 RepID=UPI00313C7212